MQKIIAILFSILSISTSYAANDKLQSALDKARIKNDVSAMQMTILMPGKDPITVVSGKTQKKDDAPDITADTLFQIGSNTKSFTSALLLKLELEKKLKLSDPITQYFPQYKKWNKVTLTDLLHNNSGIPSYTRDKAFQNTLFKHPDTMWTSEQLVDIVADKLDFQPGHGWHYSNTNFILAGMVAEKITNKPIKELYQTYFFSPLNLSNTFYSYSGYPDEILKRMAHGYSEENRDVTADNLSWGRSAGAIVSNSRDLAQWGYDLFHGKVLPPSAQKQMMSVVSVETGRPTTKDGYGLAIGTRTDKQFGKWWGHEGETIGFHAVFLWYPKYDITVAVLSNGQAEHLLEFATSVPGLVGVKAKK